MTHVGRPRNKKTGEINCTPGNSVEPIVEYLERKLHIKFHIPKFNIDSGKGIPGIDTSINLAIKDLRNRNIGGMYISSKYQMVSRRRGRWRRSAKLCPATCRLSRCLC